MDWSVVNLASYGYKGWIKLWRAEMKNHLYFAEPFTKWQAYIDLCLLADDSASVKTSLKALKTRWSWGSERKVRHFLKSDFISDFASVTIIPNKGTFIRINTEFRGTEKSKKTAKKTKSASVSVSESAFEEVLHKEVEGTKSPSNSTSPLEEYRKMMEEFDDE